MAKHKIGIAKMRLVPGKATPAPPVGAVLGQRGVNLMEFCKAFNARTKSLDPNFAVVVKLTIFSDKSFDFVVKKPEVSRMILHAASLKKGSGEPGRTIVKKISKDDLVGIAKQKMDDLNCYDLDAAVRMVAGTARSIGVDVEGLN